MPFVSWEDVASTLSVLAERVRRDGLPDAIVGLQRGGLIPAVMLSHSLNIRTVYTLNITRTLSDEIDAAKFPPILGDNASLIATAGKDILVVDDIVGTGQTLGAAQRFLLTCSPRRLRTLACFVNVANCERLGGLYPPGLISYAGTEVRDWVVFPWEGQTARPAVAPAAPL